MANLKILIVEDEFIIGENLRQMLEELGYDTIGPMGSKMTALESLTTDTPDLAILDINLKGKYDGIEIGALLNEKGIPFIYLTSNSDKATIDLAKQTNPKSYLIKPFTKDDIYATLEVTMGNLSNKQIDLNMDEDPIPILTDSIFIKSGNKYLKIRIDEIIFIEADGKSIIIHTLNAQKLHVRSSTEALLSQLKDFGFIRVHRSFCINSNHLTAINSDNVYIGQQAIPIGRIYKDELLKRVKTLS